MACIWGLKCPSLARGCGSEKDDDFGLFIYLNSRAILMNVLVHVYPLYILGLKCSPLVHGDRIEKGDDFEFHLNPWTAKCVDA